MRIILVAIHPYPSPQAIPLATAFLQSFLSSQAEIACRIEIRQFNFFIGEDPEACAQKLRAVQPDAVGFSMYAWNREQCRTIAHNLLALQPGLRLFAGGPEATADPAGVLATAPFEFIITGEGEFPLPRHAREWPQVCQLPISRVLPLWGLTDN